MKNKIHYMVQEPIDLTKGGIPKVYNVKTKAAHSYIPSGTIYFTPEEIEAGKKEAGLLTMFDQNHKYYLKAHETETPYSVNFPTKISHAVYNSIVNEVLIIEAGKTKETVHELKRKLRQNLFTYRITLEENFCFYYHTESGVKHVLGKLSPAEGTVYMRHEKEIKPHPINKTLPELIHARQRVLRKMDEEHKMTVYGRT